MAYEVGIIFNSLAKSQKMAKWPSYYLLVSQRGDCGFGKA
jgi:hypothetical protein